MRMGLGADSCLLLQAATASQCLNISRALTEQTKRGVGEGGVACCFENVIIISYLINVSSGEINAVSADEV